MSIPRGLGLKFHSNPSSQSISSTTPPRHEDKFNIEQLALNPLALLAPVAQRIEQQVSTLSVGGSSPSGRTTVMGPDTLTKRPLFDDNPK